MAGISYICSTRVKCSLKIELIYVYIAYIYRAMCSKCVQFRERIRDHGASIYRLLTT